MQELTAHTRHRTDSPRRLRSFWPALLFLAGVAAFGPTKAFALSEINREDLPPPEGTPAAPGVVPDTAAPDAAFPSDDAATPTSPVEDGDSNGIARPEIDENGPLPEIVYNLDRLPEPVRRMHDRIVEAAKSGDIEKLRPLLGLGDGKTLLSFGDPDGDPIDILKGNSGDEEGQEILAILEEILDAGFVHLEPGTPNEIYVWPYFFGIPLDKLDARQKVELFKIVTAGDLEDMKQFGTYIFYRAGITPEGEWAFFVAGE